MVLLPSVGASATDEIGALTTAAAEAKAAADAAELTAAEAESASTAAAAEAATLRAAADSAKGVLDAAADALALLPLDLGLGAALEAAKAVFDSASAAAAEAEAAAASALNQATAARSTAAALRQSAIDAQAALDAALAAGSETPSDEPVVESADEPTSELSTRTTKPDTGCDRVETGDIESLTAKDKESLIHCFPEPEIDIHVKNVCPTIVKVKIHDLLPWIEYTVWINGVEHTVEGEWSAEFIIDDFDHGEFKVKVEYLGHKYEFEKEWIKEYKCPVIKTEVEHECKLIDGKGEVEVSVWHLHKGVEYTITITGPDGFEEKFWVKDDWKWQEDLWLSPGEYTVTVEGKSKYGHVGPITHMFTVAPCPGEVDITMKPVCATDNSGSLGAVVSGLVTGREYQVILEGPGGVITDETFTATSASWNVPPSSLPPGTYTVTVIDLHSYSGGDLEMVKQQSEDPKWNKDPLTWSETGTIGNCPEVETLAMTGADPGAMALAGFLLVPFGAGLLIAKEVARRKRTAE
jgi:hypothetical protein